MWRIRIDQGEIEPRWSWRGSIRPHDFAGFRYLYRYLYNEIGAIPNLDTSGRDTRGVGHDSISKLNRRPSRIFLATELLRGRPGVFDLNDRMRTFKRCVPRV